MASTIRQLKRLLEGWRYAVDDKWGYRLGGLLVKTINFLNTVCDLERVR